MALLKETSATTGQNGYTLILRVYEDAVNDAANTSTVRIELSLRSGSMRFVDYACSGSISLDGKAVKSYSAQYSIPSLGAAIVLASYTGTVAHDDDGTRSISVSASFKCASGSYSAGSGSVSSGTLKLTAISRTPSAPKTVTAKEGGDGKYCSGGTIQLSWSRADGTVTGYEIQYSLRPPGSGTWDAWTALKSAAQTSATDARSMMFGQAVRYRVRAKNASLASGWTTSNTLVRTGGVYLRVKGTWKPGTVYRRVQGAWKQAADVYVRAGGSWRRSLP